MDDDEELSLEQLKELVDSPPIVRVANLIISQAINDRATAIHLERQVGSTRVRYRVDGVLHEVMNPPVHVYRPLTARIKMMAGMDVGERRIPQDGKIELRHDGVPYCVRVASLPCDPGEKVVLKIEPEGAAAIPDLDQLGLSPENLARLNSMLERPSGLLLVSGGSRAGKSTTLYSCLKVLNQADRNIQSIEDPIEVKIAGVNQLQVRPKLGLSFGSALRGCLRSDPDVIVLGELHDCETCRLAVDAACDRHLVLGACYGLSAASSVIRLLNLGVEPYLVSRALNGALSQRLARRICSECTTSVPAPPGLNLQTISTGVGCPACKSVGYRGQVGLQELLVNSPAIADLIAGRPSQEQVHELACDQGMICLRDDGINKVREGCISLAELLRVTRY